MGFHFHTKENKIFCESLAKRIGQMALNEFTSFIAVSGGYNINTCLGIDLYILGEGINGAE